MIFIRQPNEFYKESYTKQDGIFMLFEVFLVRMFFSRGAPTILKNTTPIIVAANTVFP